MSLLRGSSGKNVACHYGGLPSEVLQNFTVVPYYQFTQPFSIFFSRIGTVLGNISAVDRDGPSELSFSIPDKLTTTSQLVELRNFRQGADSDTRVMDIVLIKALDRDFVSLSHKHLCMTMT